MKKITLKTISILFLFSCSTPLIITKKNIELYPIKENKKIGYIDQKGKIRIKPIYDEWFDEDKIEICIEESFYYSQVIINQNNKFGVVNWKGETIIKPIYDNLYDYGEKYVALENGKYGVIDFEGNQLVPFLFDDKYFFSDDSIVVSKINNIYVIYNCFDSSTIETQYDYMSPFFGRYAEVGINNKKGIIDKNGSLILEIIYDEIEFYWEGPIAVKKEGSWYFINYKKEKVFDSSYSFATQFEDGYAVVKKEKYGVIDANGKTIVPFIYEHLFNCGNGFFQFSSVENYFFENARLGLINLKNDTILKDIYNDVFYMDNIAELKLLKTGKAGVINTRKNKILIPFQFTTAEYCKKGLSRLEFEDENGINYFGYINKRKKIIWSNNTKLLQKLLKSNQ